jgi:hypothetical protein
MLPSRPKNTLKLILMSLSLCFLFACQIKPPASSDRVVIDDLNLQSIDKQNETIKIAIHQLEIGKVLEAEILINQVLRINKSHSMAKLLKKQLTTAPRLIFDTSRTTQYKIKSGDTLGSIAKQWLGDAIYFVSLARFNNIGNSTQIQAGQLIKIPVMSNSPLVKKEKRRSRANLALLRKYTSENKFFKSLKRMDSIFIVKKHHKNLLALQNDSLNKLVESKVSISERQQMIEQIKIILSDSKRQLLKANFERFIQQQSQAVLMDEFVLLFEANSYQNAANKLIQAKKTASAKQTGLEQESATHYYRTEKLLINKLHEEAILLRKNQQLQKAADSWKLILKIQPDNDLALKYYHRTTRLLERLNNL